MILINITDKISYRKKKSVLILYNFAVFDTMVIWRIYNFNLFLIRNKGCIK